MQHYHIVRRLRRKIRYDTGWRHLFRLENRNISPMYRLDLLNYLLRCCDLKFLRYNIITSYDDCAVRSRYGTDWRHLLHLENITSPLRVGLQLFYPSFNISYPGNCLTSKIWNWRRFKALSEQASQWRNAAATTCVRRQRQASNTTPATCNASVVGARSPTTTTAVEQYVRYTQAADAGQLMICPVVSLLNWRMRYIVERMTPGNR